MRAQVTFLFAWISSGLPTRQQADKIGSDRIIFFSPFSSSFVFSIMGRVPSPSPFCSCSPIYRIMLRFRILAAAAIGQGRRRLVHLVDERGILTFVVAPLLRLLGIFPCRLPPSRSSIGLSLSETPASGLAFEACGGRRRGRFLSNGVKGKRGEGDAGRRTERGRKVKPMLRMRGGTPLASPRARPPSP